MPISLTLGQKLAQDGAWLSGQGPFLLGAGLPVWPPGIPLELGFLGVCRGARGVHSQGAGGTAAGGCPHPSGGGPQ